MERLFLECAIRAALLVAGTALVLYAMRVKAAAAKHSVWAAVVLLMLVLPIWTAWGPKAPLRVLPPLGQRTANEAIVPGWYAFNRVRTIATTFDPASRFTGRLPVGALLTSVAAGNRHCPRTQTGSRRAAPQMACVLAPHAPRQ